MDFLNLVAEQLFDWNAVPNSPRNVQIAMHEIMTHYCDKQGKDLDDYRIIVQGRIEIDKHIQMYGLFS